MVNTRLTKFIYTQQVKKNDKKKSKLQTAAEEAHDTE